MMMRLILLGLGLLPAAWAQTTTPSEVLDRYLAGNPSVCEAGQRAVEMSIDAKVPKLDKQGSMHGLKVVSDSGQVAYRFLKFTGDKLVKTDVIARFLTAETQAKQQTGDISISRTNYKIKYSRSEMGSYVYELRPRKKRTGLFKGELWLDPATAQPSREKGEFVKSPSIFVKRIRFVRDYRAGCGPPERTSIVVQTRIAGDAEMVVVQHPVASDWVPAEGESAAAPGLGQN